MGYFKERKFTFYIAFLFFLIHPFFNTFNTLKIWILEYYFSLSYCIIKRNYWPKAILITSTVFGSEIIQEKKNYNLNNLTLYIMFGENGVCYLGCQCLMFGRNFLTLLKAYSKWFRFISKSVVKVSSFGENESYFLGIRW